MKKFDKNIANIKSTVTGMLLLLFVTYFANISLFLHYHVVDGVTIVHSHIHDSDHTQDPFDTSTHSKRELTLINALSIFFAETPCELFVSNVISALICTLLIALSASIIQTNGIKQPPLRGPPAEIIFS
ncbi:MAG: hypothetical protein R3Y39_04775 [Rikenellaceae bacterium]